MIDTRESPKTASALESAITELQPRQDAPNRWVAFLAAGLLAAASLVGIGTLMTTRSAAPAPVPSVAQPDVNPTQARSSNASDSSSTIDSIQASESPTIDPTRLDDDVLLWDWIGPWELQGLAEEVLDTGRGRFRLTVSERSVCVAFESEPASCATAEGETGPTGPQGAAAGAGAANIEQTDTAFWWFITPSDVSLELVAEGTSACQMTSIPIGVGQNAALWGCERQGGFPTPLDLVVVRDGSSVVATIDGGPPELLPG